jgi:hypothetical protein
MKLRPDDEIRRARLVYLGWGKTALPIQWPYAKLLLFGAVFVVSSLLLFAIFRTVLLLSTTFVASMVATSYIFDRVDPDRPARKVIRTALTDWRTDGADDGTETELPAFNATHIRLETRR